MAYLNYQMWDNIHWIYQDLIVICTLTFSMSKMSARRTLVNMQSVEIYNMATYISVFANWLLCTWALDKILWESNTFNNGT